MVTLEVSFLFDKQLIWNLYKIKMSSDHYTNLLKFVSDAHTKWEEK